MISGVKVDAKRNERNGDKHASVFPSGWTTTTNQRKAGRGTWKQFVSPDGNTFQSLKSALAFVAIMRELMRKSDGKEQGNNYGGKTGRFQVGPWKEPSEPEA